jgi:hypothetical protein
VPVEPADAGNDEIMGSLTNAITLIFLFLAAVLALRQFNSAQSCQRSDFPGESSESPDTDRNDRD